MHIYCTWCIVQSTLQKCLQPIYNFNQIYDCSNFRDLSYNTILTIETEAFVGLETLYGMYVFLSLGIIVHSDTYVCYYT